MRILSCFLCMLAAFCAGASAQQATSDADLIESKLKLLNLRERVAQLMLVTMQGFQGPNDNDRALLKECVPGGVVISAALTPAQGADYVRLLRSTPVEAAKGIPLLIATDLYHMTQSETRLPVTFSQLPSLLSVGAARDINATERLAAMMAQHLAAMGFNMNLGPSLELAPTLPDAPGDTHTFGSDPAFAAQAGAAMTRTLIAGGIIPAPMGFPGGGLDRQGQSPAALLTPSGLLAERDLRPYQAAIDAGAPVINIANTLAPALDKQNRPASLSPDVYRVLRNDLKFSGVAVAGPLDVPDVARLHDPARAAVMAVQAGADMIFWTTGGEHAVRGVNSIVQAVERGEISAQRIEESVRRVLTLKRAHHLSARIIPDAKTADALEKKKVGNEAYDIERRSITLVKNDGGVLPLSEKTSLPAGVTGVVGVELMKTALEEYLKPVVEQPIRTAQHLGEIEDFEISRLTSGVRGMRTAICVFTGLRRSMGEARLIRELKAQGVRVVVVLLGYPKNLPQLLEADAIVLAYCDEARYNESIRAAADVIAGAPPVRITSTTQDIRLKAGKSEFFDIRNVIHAPAGRLPVNVQAPFDAGYALTYQPQLKKVEWDFGDGHKSKQPRAEHAYKKPGRYTATLSVVDTQGTVTSGVFAVLVE